MGVSVASVPRCVVVAMGMEMVEFGPVRMSVVMGVTMLMSMLVIVTLSVSVLVAIRDVVRAIVIICHVVYIYPEQDSQQEKKG